MAELARAELHRRHLDLARSALNFPIRITSFVRVRNVGSGTHADGSAIDIQPWRTPGGVAIDNAEFARRLERLYQYYRDIDAMRPLYGVVIHERDHLHITLPGVQNRTGAAFREPTEGHYVLDTIFRGIPVFMVALLLIIVWAVIV